MNLQQLLRDLRITLRSEEHTTEEWQVILGKLQEIGNLTVMRLRMSTVPSAERVENKEEKG